LLLHTGLQAPDFGLQVRAQSEISDPKPGARSPEPIYREAPGACFDRSVPALAPLGQFVVHIVISMREIRTRLLALAAAAFMALPAQALVNTSYLCHMTGRVSESRCCASKHADICHAQVEAQDCCQLMQSRGQAAGPATRSSTQDAPTGALIATPAVSLLARAPSTRTHEAPPADTHPPGPPRFLVNCSLLI
jgi:hypothetical protein